MVEDPTQQVPDKPQADGKQQPLGESPFKRSHPCQDGQEGGKGGVCRHGRLPQRQHQGREEENVNGGLGVTGLPTMQHLDSRYPPTNLQTLPISTSLSTGLHSSLGAGGSVSRSAWHHTTGQGDSWSDIQIIVKEVQPIVMGTVMWGVQW